MIPGCIGGAALGETYVGGAVLVEAVEMERAALVSEVVVEMDEQLVSFVHLDGG